MPPPLAPPPTETDVIIIGGGGTALSLSIFLSNHSVPHLLFERHPSTSNLPKAHYLNQRTMEIFRQHNLTDAVRALSAPLKNFCHAGYQTTLAGDGPWDRKVFAAIAGFGGDVEHLSFETYAADGPEVAGNLPQIRLEPVLKREAERRNEGGVKFGCEVVDFEDRGGYVLATVREGSGVERLYRAKYLVAADGGKTANAKLGIAMEGVAGFADAVGTHFKADLSEYWDGRNMMTWFCNPENGGDINQSGVVIQMGPTWGAHSEEWVLLFGYPLSDPRRHDEASMLPQLRQILRLPDLQAEVLKVSHWTIERVVADKYGVGRVFIAGDAAHRFPPMGGLGLNTGIEDAHALAWRLALVTKGLAGHGLMETYGAERRPVGEDNSHWAFFCFQNAATFSAAIGLQAGRSDEVTAANKARMEFIFGESRPSRAARAQIDRVIQTNEAEFRAHDQELGFVYESLAVVGDGTETPERHPLGLAYNPTTRPGHRLPHCWLSASGTGRRVSTHDLVGAEGGFCLVTDEFGEGPWGAAVVECGKKSNVPIKMAVIATSAATADGARYGDVEGRWRSLRQIEDGGAVLVRPDNFVGFRCANALEKQDAARVLKDAIGKILGTGT